MQGWNDASLEAKLNYRQSYEPVFVLHNDPAYRLALQRSPAHEEL